MTDDKWSAWRMLGWPKLILTSDLLTGAAEVGQSLYCVGGFGSFGGWLGSMYPDKEWAVEDAHEWNSTHESQQSVFEISLKMAVETP